MLLGGEGKAQMRVHETAPTNFRENVPGNPDEIGLSSFFQLAHVPVGHFTTRHLEHGDRVHLLVEPRAVLGSVLPPGILELSVKDDARERNRLHARLTSAELVVLIQVPLRELHARGHEHPGVRAVCELHTDVADVRFCADEHELRRKRCRGETDLIITGDHDSRLRVLLAGDHRLLPERNFTAGDFLRPRPDHLEERAIRTEQLLPGDLPRRFTIGQVARLDLHSERICPLVQPRRERLPIGKNENSQDPPRVKRFR